MEDHLAQHDTEIAEIKGILTTHIEQENQDVFSLRRDLNGNLAKIHETTDNIAASLLRMEPVIKKYEDERVFQENIQKLGDKVIRYGKIVTGSGILIYAIRAFIRNGF